jgi:hypothetical protein
MRGEAMSRHELRGTAAWDDCGEGTSSLGTDFRWELGYDPAGITYYAQLWDEAPMDDPECPLTEEELARPIIWIGEMPYSILTVEELEREMDAATGANPELPAELAAKLREERERHLAGQLGEAADVVSERLLLFREIEVRFHLTEMQRFIGRPPA